jgi:hypothetical protein
MIARVSIILLYVFLALIALSRAELPNLRHEYLSGWLPGDVSVPLGIMRHVDSRRNVRGRRRTIEQ